MSRHQDSVARWREILRRQAGSGLSAAAFCRRSHIPQSSFYVWCRKLRSAATFTEVHVAPAAARDDGASESFLPRHDGALEVVLPGGRRIVVRPGFDRATLLALVDALERGTARDAIQESGA